MKLLLSFLLACLLALSLACSNGCNSLPASAYGKAKSLQDLVEPLVVNGLFILSESKASTAQQAFDALSKVLVAWRQADAGKFDSALPCAVAALENVAAVSEGEVRRTLDTTLKFLRSLNGDRVCTVPKGDEDAGVASLRTHLNPLAMWRHTAGVGRGYVQGPSWRELFRTIGAPVLLCERDPSNARCRVSLTS